MDIKTLFETTTLTYKQMSAATGLTYKQVHSRVHRLFTADQIRARKRHTYGRAWKEHHAERVGARWGKEHVRYKEKMSDGKGYTLVHKPDWYIGRAGSRHVFEHQVVVCAALGIKTMPKGYVVHHCNAVKTDNSFDNLVLLTMGGHTHFHQIYGHATTISKESTLKWAEAQGVLWHHDIV